MRGIPTAERVKSVLPSPLLASALKVRNKAQALRYRGNAVACPICEGTYARFLPRNNRPDAVCPGCYSLERHRMFWLYLQRCTDLLSSSARVLHLAPETQLEQRFRALSNLDYHTADLLRKDVDYKLDVTGMDLPDESFDVILCSHVLEHVPDDRQAMRELRRVLRRTGWALLTAPVEDDREDTFEDWSVSTPEGRVKAFGQWDHVRRYGRNFPDLLREQGWDVEVKPMPLSDDESKRFGIPEIEQRIYLSRRSR